jgi:cytoskeletal protein RodZ
MKKPTSKMIIGLVAILAAGLLVAVLVFSWPHKTTGTQPASSNSPSPSVEASPGTAGNAGDQAKSQLATPSPSSSSATTSETPAQSPITIQSFIATPQNGGQLRVSTQISGISNGACQLTLSDPAGKNTQATGQISYSGTYYFCSFDSISGISAAGSWSANLTVTSGSLSQSAKTTFKVAGQ